MTRAADVPTTPRADDAANGASAIDLTVLATLLDFDAVKVRRLALAFLHSTRAGLDKMTQALAAGRTARVRELGHRIKSAARTVGAFGMGTLCEQIEELPPAAPEVEQAAAQALLARLWPLFEQIAVQILQHTGAPADTP